MWELRRKELADQQHGVQGLRSGPTCSRGVPHKTCGKTCGKVWGTKPKSPTFGGRGGSD